MMILAASGKKGLLGVLFLLSTGIATWLLFFFFLPRKKWGRVAFIGAGSLLAGFLLFNTKTLFTEKRIIIPPFEVEALLYLQDSSQKITFLRPEKELQYRAVTPLLYADPEIGKVLLESKWEVVQSIHDKTRGLIVAPRYLKREVLPEQIIQYKLIKVFDNSQIEIYLSK